MCEQVRKRKGPSFTPKELDCLRTVEFQAPKFPSGAAFWLAHPPSLARLPVIHSWVTPANPALQVVSALWGSSLVTSEPLLVLPARKGTVPYQALRLAFLVIPVVYYTVETPKVVDTALKSLFSNLAVTYTWHHSRREGWMRGGPGVAKIHKNSVDVLV